MGSIDFPSAKAMKAADALAREAVADPGTAKQKAAEISKIIPDEPIENIDAYVAAAIDALNGKRKMYYVLIPR